MLIMNRDKHVNDVVKKYHISQPTFDIDDVYKIKSVIRRKTTKIVSTEHFKEMQKERNIPLYPIYRKRRKNPPFRAGDIRREN